METELFCFLGHLHNYYRMLQNLPDLTMYQILHILWPFISQAMINKRLYQSDESTTSRSDVPIKFPDENTEYEDDKEYSDVPTKYIRNDYIEYPDDDKEYEDLISDILDQVANPVRDQFDTTNGDPIIGTSSSFFPEYEDIS